MIYYKKITNTQGSIEETRRGIQAYGTWDLGLKYKFDDNWQVDVGVNDLLNKGYGVRTCTDFGYDYQGYTIPCPLTGRMYYMTLGYSF